MLVTIMIADKPDGGVSLVVRKQGAKRLDGGGAEALAKQIQQALLLLQMQVAQSMPDGRPPVADAAGPTEDDDKPTLKIGGKK